MYKIRQIYKTYKIFKNVNKCLGKKAAILKITVFSNFFYNGHVWVLGGCFLLKFFSGQPGEGKRDPPFITSTRWSQHSLCCASAAPVWLREDMTPGTPRQDPIWTKLQGYGFLFPFHKFTAWTCPTHEHQAPMTGSARTCVGNPIS